MSPAITIAARRVIEEVTREKTTHPHINSVGPCLLSHLYNRDRSLGRISRSEVASPRSSRTGIRRRTLSRHRCAERGLRQADPQRKLRSKAPEIDRTSAEEGNRLGDREGAGRVPARGPDVERRRSFGATQGDRGSAGSNAFLVEVRAVYAHKV